MVVESELGTVETAAPKHCQHCDLDVWPYYEQRTPENAAGHAGMRGPMMARCPKCNSEIVAPGQALVPEQPVARPSVLRVVPPVSAVPPPVSLDSLLSGARARLEYLRTELAKYDALSTEAAELEKLLGVKSQ